MKEIAILPAMILLSHTRPVELSIQKKAGGKMWLLFFIRVSSSIVKGVVLNLILPGGKPLPIKGWLQWRWQRYPYWLIANIIGLIYGAGILITANENKDLEKEEISRLNVSICSMHSIIQETANFLVLGVPILILIIPRFITAVLSVWLYRLVMEVKRKIRG